MLSDSIHIFIVTVCSNTYRIKKCSALPDMSVLFRRKSCSKCNSIPCRTFKLKGSKYCICKITEVTRHLERESYPTRLSIVVHFCNIGALTQELTFTDCIM